MVIKTSRCVILRFCEVLASRARGEGWSVVGGSGRATQPLDKATYVVEVLAVVDWIDWISKYVGYLVKSRKEFRFYVYCSGSQCHIPITRSTCSQRVVGPLAETI